MLSSLPSPFFLPTQMEWWRKLHPCILGGKWLGCTHGCPYKTAVLFPHSSTVDNSPGLLPSHTSPSFSQLPDPTVGQIPAQAEA
jgi:hypothetical protein